MDILYLKIDKNIKIPGEEVRLGQIADLRCPGNPGLEREAGKLKLPAGRITGPGRYVYSILEVLDAVQKKYPGIPVVNLGEADFILTLEKETGKGEIRQWLKTGFVCLLTFFGAAFSIMAFTTTWGSPHCSARCIISLPAEPPTALPFWSCPTPWAWEPASSCF